MPAHDARGRARHIEQDTVECAAVPPRGRCARIALNEPDLPIGKAQADEAFLDAREPRGVDVERQQVDVGALEDVRGLAAGRRAGIEDAQTVVYVEERRGVLRGEVLDRERAVRKSGKLGHRTRLRDDQSRRSGRFGGHAGRRELPQQLVAPDEAPIDAQRKRRTRIARFEDRLPVLGMVAARAIDPPLRIRPARDVARDNRAAHVVLLAQVSAQERIGERLRRGPHRFARRRHCAIDDGESGCARVIELVDGDGHQRAEQRIGDRLSRETANDRVERAPVPQRAVRELLHERAPAQRARIVDCRQCLAQVGAVEHPRDGQRGQHLLALHRALIGRPRTGGRARHRVPPRTPSRTSCGRPRAAPRRAAARRGSHPRRRRRRSPAGRPRQRSPAPARQRHRGGSRREA
jgi:hypothetical protein